MTMDTFISLTSVAASLPDANIDTDIIFPARFLLLTEKKGLGRYAFYEKRFLTEGTENPDFILNRAPFRHAQILVTGDNFGSGSSREHAPWALSDFGIRCVISTSFGEIFYANCFKNSMLPITVSAPELALLRNDADAGQLLTIDLIGKKILHGAGQKIAFDIPDWRREALINGWDDIAMILNQEGTQIAAFEARQQHSQPWLWA